MSRSEEIKDYYQRHDENFGLSGEQVDWLINRVKELEYASKYNGELNEFLQKRKLAPNTLGRHVVDVVMDYVEELEEENRTLKEFQKQWHENMFGKENISE